MPLRGVGDSGMGLENLSDDSVLRLYENIREQAAADLGQWSPHRLLGEKARQQAERLRQELERRRLQHAHIDWR
jgi:hypothetical protein